MNIDGQGPKEFFLRVLFSVGITGAIGGAAFLIMRCYWQAIAETSLRVRVA
jgi:hypothetical protein